MSKHTPTTEQVRWQYTREEPPRVGTVSEKTAEFDRWLAAEKAKAWEEGHRHRQRLGPDDCACGAWYEGECACGQYGTGDLLSLADNPHREHPMSEHATTIERVMWGVLHDEAWSMDIYETRDEAEAKRRAYDCGTLPLVQITETVVDVGDWTDITAPDGQHTPETTGNQKQNLLD